MNSHDLMNKLKDEMKELFGFLGVGISKTGRGSPEFYLCMKCGELCGCSEYTSCDPGDIRCEDYAGCISKINPSNSHRIGLCLACEVSGKSAA
jgi:hypothetical protein